MFIHNTLMFKKKKKRKEIPDATTVNHIEIVTRLFPL